MPPSPFTPPLERLPASLPIFPLPGAIVMPGAVLPLNIFEPRYLNMVLDSLGEQRMIGMVQPKAAPGQLEAVHGTGTGGRITAFSETDDGRFLIQLTGVCRFEIRSEIPTTRGYRRVVPDWRRFAGDYRDDDALAQRDRLLSRLRRYVKHQRLDLDWKAIEPLADGALVNVLVTHLPLAAAEKQALVEAVTLAERADLLAALLEFEAVPPTSLDDHRH